MIYLLNYDLWANENMGNLSHVTNFSGKGQVPLILSFISSLFHPSIYQFFKWCISTSQKRKPWGSGSVSLQYGITAPHNNSPTKHYTIYMRCRMPGTTPITHTLGWLWFILCHTQAFSSAWNMLKQTPESPWQHPKWLPTGTPFHGNQPIIHKECILCDVIMIHV